MITCYTRYVLDLQKMDAFTEYGRLWIRAITKLGGTHHGYFVPSQDPEATNHRQFSFPDMGSEGPSNVGVAIFSFPEWEAYERYRREGGSSEEGRRATMIANETKCFISYERNFMLPVAS